MKVGESAKVHRLSASKHVLGSPASTEKTAGKKNTRTDEGTETHEPEGAATPVKAEASSLVGPTRLDFSGHAFSSGDHGERVLEAPAALSTKIDALSINAGTKSDVATLKAEMVASTRTAIAEAVGPRKTRVAALEAHPPWASTAHSPEIQRTMDHLLVLSKDMDPNFKRVSFLGFKDIPSTARLDAIEKFMKKSPKFSNYRADHEFCGKQGEQVMKNASSVEFPSPDVAKNFFKEVEAKKGTAEFPIAGVTVKRAFSKANRQRNYALRKAEEVINAKFLIKCVRIDHKERSFSMDSTVVFQQTPNEFWGTLSGSMAGSCLP